MVRLLSLSMYRMEICLDIFGEVEEQLTAITMDLKSNPRQT